jgi:hypothetical protein
VPQQPRHRVELVYPGGRLSGRVVYREDGRPAPGILVVVHAPESSRRANPLADANFGDEASVADSAGRFVFDGLPAGRYEVYAREMNWAGIQTAQGAGRLTGLVIREGEHLEDLEVRLTGGGSLRVTVTDQGRPRQGALVRVLTENGLPMNLLARTRTDGTGTIVFRNVPAGTYRVGVDAQGAVPETSRPVEVEDGEQTAVALDLRTGVRLRLRIVAAARDVRAGERCLYSIWERRGVLLRAGVFTLSPAGDEDRVQHDLDLGSLARGTVVLRIESASFGVVEERREVSGSGRQEWKLELRRK